VEGGWGRIGSNYLSKELNSGTKHAISAITRCEISVTMGRGDAWRVVFNFGLILLAVLVSLGGGFTLHKKRSVAKSIPREED
jgi:hypothetical protein